MGLVEQTRHVRKRSNQPRFARARDESIAEADRDVDLLLMGQHPFAAPYGFKTDYLKVPVGPLGKRRLRPTRTTTG